ncbi:MAG: polysaccharide deacetylase family protein [Flavobacterium sp.]|nr:MAG: polysaccharide deacetylase family protein [Flavobacterium sp.]
MIYAIVALAVLVVGILIYLDMQLRILTPAGNKLLVLEYHSISTDGFEDQITISKEKLITHLEYLRDNGYKTMWLSQVDEFQKLKKPLPPKTVVLTFDDGYKNNYTELFPLLKQYDMKATCFMVLGRIGQNIDWPGQYVNDTMELMTKDQLIEVGSHIEIAHHTFKHDNYTKISFEEIDADLKKCNDVILSENLNVFPALAYTFGRYYRKKGEKQDKLYSILEQNGIRYALRIGNRINKFPLKSFYDIQRTDIRGTDSFADFKKKVRFGRKKIF